MKKICILMIFIISVSIFSLPSIANAAVSGECGAGVSWTYDSGKLTISGNGAIANYDTTLTPWYNYSTEIRNIVISEGITAIGKQAFYGLYISSIYIPESVIRIESAAFYNCTSLNSITGGKSVSYIGANAFGNTAWYSNCANGLITLGNVVYKYKGTQTGITKITIPDGIISISKEAFYSCSNLESVTLPNSIEVIGENSFYGCSGLKTMVLPQSVIEIEKNAFRYCSNLSKVYILNKTCSIYDTSTTFYSTSTIYGFNDSTADDFAEKYSRTFVALKDDGMPFEISSVSVKKTNQTYTIKPTINPHISYDGEKNVIVAFYNTEDSFLGLTVLELSDMASVLTLSTDITFDYCKIFLWESLNNPYPLANEFVYELDI